jgi:hypothetical protein
MIQNTFFSYTGKDRSLLNMAVVMMVFEMISNSFMQVLNSNVFWIVII